VRSPIPGWWCCAVSPANPPELAAAGPRVQVRTVRPEDVETFRRAVLASAERIGRWNPVTPDDLPGHIARQSADHRTFLVFANAPEGGQPLVGRANLNGVVRGRFRSVAMGYDAYDPYAGRGLFGEGLRLVLDLAFAPVTRGGMDLHRVEANVQPGNTSSAGLLRSLGFRPEGFSPRYLYLPDESGREQWRDHERFALTAEEWPAAPYAAPVREPLVVLLDTLGTVDGMELARAVGRELQLPLLPAELARSTDLVGLVRDCPGGAVVAGAWGQPELDQTLTGLRAAFPTAPLVGIAGIEPPTGRAVTRLALELRAGARTGR
jgi:ribosomal-protein-alanine N-acetyltransferase